MKRILSLVPMLFQWWNEPMPDKNGGGSHNTDVEGSTPDGSTNDDEIDEIGARGPAPTQIITQPEDESKNPMDLLDGERNEDGRKDVVLGQTHISEPVSDHHEILPPTGYLGVDIAINGDQAPVLDPTPITEPEVESRGTKRPRARNWEAHETEMLIKFKLQNLDWDQISVLISDRSSTQCQQRWDTIVKPYNKVKRRCDALGIDISHVPEQELRSLKVAMDSANKRHWFKMVHKWYSSKSGVPANDLNGGIWALGSVGENVLPGNPVVVLGPDVVTTGPPVQAICVGAAVRFPHVCLEWKVVLQIVAFMSCVCFGAVNTCMRVLLQFRRESARTW